MHPESAYTDLIAKILAEGDRRSTRNATTLSLFGERLIFDVGTHGFPLLTTKRVFWRGVVEELIWFLKGSTNSKDLEKAGVNIWKGNTSREFLDKTGLHEYDEGICGPIYGFQWRNFGGTYDASANAAGNMKKMELNGVDQLKDVITQLQMDPTSRRMIISAWNPTQHGQMCLPACHTMYQFYKSQKGLSCQLMARSQDIILGTPFNIASTALLTTLLAHMHGWEVDKIVLCMGDAHVYENHIDGAKQQIEREPLPFPKVVINKPRPTSDATVDEYLIWLESLQAADIELVDYKCHAAIKFDMVA